MSEVHLSVENEEAWCIKIIKNAAAKAKKRKYQNGRDLLILNEKNEAGLERLDLYYSQQALDDFSKLEIILLIQKLVESV